MLNLDDDFVGHRDVDIGRRQSFINMTCLPCMRTITVDAYNYCGHLSWQRFKFSAVLSKGNSRKTPFGRQGRNLECFIGPVTKTWFPLTLKNWKRGIFWPGKSQGFFFNFSRKLDKIQRIFCESVGNVRPKSKYSTSCFLTSISYKLLSHWENNVIHKWIWDDKSNILIHLIEHHIVSSFLGINTFMICVLEPFGKIRENVRNNE